MDNKETFKKLVATSDIQTALYLSQMSLELSGDIERNPGPTKKINCSIHPEILILLLITLLIVIEKKETNFYSTHPNANTKNINCSIHPEILILLLI